MQSGMLWYDKSKTPILDKIVAVAKRYQEKFGVVPDTCFVNPHDAPTAESVQGIRIGTKPTILQNHIWLGVGRPFAESILAPTEPNGDDAHPNEPAPPSAPTLDIELEEVPLPPALVLEPVRITDFVTLITAARHAAQSLDHLLQFHEPRDRDVTALETLHDALQPFLPA